MLDRVRTARTDDARGFTSSYRANAACARELARLYDGVADELEVSREPLPGADGGEPLEAPVIRRSPGRCLVQVGRVALTMTWLQRAQCTVADGELLVVVWRGAVATRLPRRFERADQPADATTATALWEMVLTAEAESEAAWGWTLASASGEAMSTPALAHRCIDALRRAHAEEHLHAG